VIERALSPCYFACIGIGQGHSALPDAAVMEENVVLAVRGSESASTDPAWQTSSSGSPSSASPGTEALLPGVMFDTAVTSITNNAGVRSPISATSSSTLSGKPIQSTPAVGASGTSWPLFLGQEPTTLGPWLTSGPGGTVAKPTSTNKTQGPDEPQDPNEPLNDPWPASGPAAQAEYYADQAQAYAEVAGLLNGEAQYDYRQVEIEAAVASPADRAKTDQALDLAHTGAEQAAAGAKAAQYAAFDAGVDAAAATTAAENGDYAEAVVQAGFAKDAMVEAQGARNLTDQGAGKVIEARYMLLDPWPK
jgi:hypothetical protein